MCAALLCAGHQDPGGFQMMSGLGSAGSVLKRLTPRLLRDRADEQNCVCIKMLTVL